MAIQRYRIGTRCPDPRPAQGDHTFASFKCSRGGGRHRPPALRVGGLLCPRAMDIETRAAVSTCTDGRRNWPNKRPQQGLVLEGHLDPGAPGSGNAAGIGRKGRIGGAGGSSAHRFLWLRRGTIPCLTSRKGKPGLAQSKLGATRWWWKVTGVQPSNPRGRSGGLRLAHPSHQRIRPGFGKRDLDQIADLVIALKPH